MSDNRVSVFKKLIFFVLGSLSLIMSYIGVALPGVPGIPFILLTAYFYVRSSDRMYNWLLNHRLFGKLLSNFRKHQQIPLSFKIFVIMQLWVSILVAQIWFLSDLFWRITVVLMGVVSSIIVARMKQTQSARSLKC